MILFPVDSNVSTLIFCVFESRELAFIIIVLHFNCVPVTEIVFDSNGHRLIYNSVEIKRNAIWFCDESNSIEFIVILPPDIPIEFPVDWIFSIWSIGEFCPESVIDDELDIVIDSLHINFVPEIVTVLLANKHLFVCNVDMFVL